SGLGRRQVGDSQFVEREPAMVNVAGDAGSGPTYAVFGALTDEVRPNVGDVLTKRLAVDGAIRDDPALARYGVTAGLWVTETNHVIAAPFWAFMTSAGTVYENGQFTSAALFQNAYFATGYPISEAYWVTVQVGGQTRDVLVQCFERRCLTYTPGNPDGWQVEAGNVGLHYYQWRYGQQQVDAGPSALANELAAAVRGATTTPDRIAALLAVLDALHVGVYAPDGTLLLGGAERGPADFYLYDFEVQMLAGAIERGQTWGV